MMLDENPLLGCGPDCRARHSAADCTSLEAPRDRRDDLGLQCHEQTLDIVDRAYILFDGQVKVSGNVRDLVFDDTVADIYLGPTLTARLRSRFHEEPAAADAGAAWRPTLAAGGGRMKGGLNQEPSSLGRISRSILACIKRWTCSICPCWIRAAPPKQELLHQSVPRHDPEEDEEEQGGPRRKRRPISKPRPRSQSRSQTPTPMTKPTGRTFSWTDSSRPAA